MRKTYKGVVNKLTENQVYVYGQNTQARNGKGAALKALKFGAENGVLGVSGQTYGIITKDLTKKVHPSILPEQIITQIQALYLYALKHVDKEFLIIYSTEPTLNGYTPEEMASFFSCDNIPTNIVFEYNFSKLIFKTPDLFSE